MQPAPRFTHTQQALRQLAADALAHARRLGADGAEVDISEGHGLSVTVRRDAVDTIEHNRDKSLGITVYLGARPNARRGAASTSDFSPEAVAGTVEAAVAIARHTAVDDCSGPPEPELLASAFPDLDLYHPWQIGAEEAIEIARRCEAAAFGLSKKLKNSEGATVSAQHSQYVLANSHGFAGGHPSSRHSLWLSVIAEDRGLMQRDDWFTSSRVPAALAAPEAVGRYAGERALARLGARKIATRRAPVLFEAPLACALVGSFVSAVSGVNLYRKSTFLADSLGTQVFSDNISIHERPHLPRGLASGVFDEEGVATRERAIVRAGVLEGYFLGCYSARKLGMKSTGSSGGHHNLIVEPDGPDFAGMLKTMGTGLLVTELLGHGVNLVTGDYSRGAAGYWVENGVIAHPVEEITIAGNLRDMFRAIAAVGTDQVVRSGRTCGSILIESMTIAGA